MSDKLAIVYDFDGTLISGEMLKQIIADLGMNTSDFLNQSNEYARKHCMDRVCSYMLLLLKKAQEKKKKLTPEYMKEIGRGVKMRPGLVGKESWFDRVNENCRTHGLYAEHYVVTSGLAEIVEASPIVKHIERVFGSRFHYDDKLGAVWPAQVVNHTTKTQYLFRINKGKLNERDEREPNIYMAPEDRPVPFENMIFIGDGETDIPCFSLVKNNGGHAIAVLRNKPDSRQTLEQLVADNRVDLVSLTLHFECGGKLFKSIERITRKLGRKRK